MKRMMHIKQVKRRGGLGFSMIELLVAVLIMGVGVLGVTGLQMVSLQNNRDALMRSDALEMASDILDRIRANPGGGAIPGAAYGGVGFDDEPAAPNDCFANNCSEAQMAAFDIAVWQCSLGAHNELEACEDLRQDTIIPAREDQPGLPNGEGQIDIDAAGIITVSIRWTGFDGLQQLLVVESQG